MCVCINAYMHIYIYTDMYIYIYSFIHAKMLAKAKMGLDSGFGVVKVCPCSSYGLVYLRLPKPSVFEVNCNFYPGLYSKHLQSTQNHGLHPNNSVKAHVVGQVPFQCPSPFGPASSKLEREGVDPKILTTHTYRGPKDHINIRI